ncbi:MAG: alpha/beta hydrolase [Acidimicrobiia bacterium]|nr:alpha/beta hydrolase [Acidimicrobiia bacterium]
MKGDADTRPAGWKTERGRRAYLEAYDSAMELWPVPYRSRHVETRFGVTHVVVSGPSDGEPLVLLHAATDSLRLSGTPTWPRRLTLVPCTPSTTSARQEGVQTKPMFCRHDCRDWLPDVLDGLGLTSPIVVGSSQGGWLALNLSLLAPERVDRLALLAPAASILPFRRLMRLMIAVGPYMPAWTGPPSVKAMFGGRTVVDHRIVDLLTLHLAHFRYQKRAPFPSAFATDELRQLAVQTLLLIGAHEVIYDPEAALTRASSGDTDVHAELVSNSGHLINMEHPGLTNDRLLLFCARSRAQAERL